MKKATVVLMIIALAVVAVLGAAVFASRILGSSTTEPSVAHCVTKGAQHTVTIENGKVLPQHTEAILCDTLTILSKDDRIRLMAFGTHDHHQPYDGVDERALEQGQSFTVTLNLPGSFAFHDHLDDSVVGSFMVLARPAN